jgi:hypothetical protein
MESRSTQESAEMSLFSMFVWGTRRTSLLIAALMIGLVAAIDAHTSAEIPLGFLYLAPMLVVGASLSRWEIGAVAAVCAWLAEAYDAFPWGPNTGLPRDLLYFAAFFCMGLFMHEVTRSRRLSARHMRQIEGEMTARRDAEEQLKVLVDSSPAAIITTRHASWTIHPVLFAIAGQCACLGQQPPGFPHRNAMPRTQGGRRGLPGRRLVLHLCHQRRPKIGGHGAGYIGRFTNA